MTRAEPRAGATPRRRWRRGLFWLWAAPLALALAWLASNLVDDRPKPRPAVLQLDRAVVATPLTAALTGLFAPDVAPHVAAAPGAAAGPAAQAAAPAQQLPANLALLGCERGTDRVALWQQALADGTLGAQLQRHVLLRQRCEAALAPALQPGAAIERLFTEPLQSPLRPGADLAPHGRGALQCGQLLIGQALLAAAAGDREAALRQLALSDRLARAQLLGSRTLISHAFSWSLLHRHYDALALVAQIQPGWAAELLALAPELPAQALSPARWAAAESSYQQALSDTLPTHCPPLAGIWVQAEGWSYCLMGLVWLPEANRQAADRRWLAMIERAAAAGPFNPPAAMAPASGSRWQQLRWRNTLGDHLLEALVPAFEPYLAQQADVLLHRQTLALALAASAERWPAGEIGARLAANATPALAARIRLAEDGRSLLAQPWRSAKAPGAAAPSLRVALPPAH